MSTALLSEDERLARLQHEARERKWPNVRPVDAATLIILDRQSPTPRVLMGKRHANLKFMPNMFVFPGGRSEGSDSGVPVAGELAMPVVDALQKRVVRPSIARARRLALTAIRETFEETGLVIGHKAVTKGSVTASNLTNTPWADFAATGFLPDLSPLTFLARAITPPKRPKRFDTRFFVVEHNAIAHRIEGIITPESELTELVWLTLEETAAQPLPAITRVILADLQAAILAGGPAHHQPVPFYYEQRRQFQRELIEV